MGLPAIGLALALGLAPAQVAAASDPTAAARSALRVLHASGAQLDEAEKARDRVAALTGVISGYEAGLTALRDGMRQVAIHEAALSRALAAEDARVARLLGALAALEATPQSLMMLHPSGPLDAVRSGMVMAEIAPELQRQAQDLRARLEEVRQVRALQAAALAELSNGLRDVQAARVALSQAIANRGALPDGADEKAAAAARLAQASRSIEAFLDGLTASDVPVLALSQEVGPPLLPVQGRLLRGYDEPDAAGIKRPGWLFATQAQALVTAPSPATIRYLGPLLDYGKVMILEPSSDTLLVLAGLGTVYGEIGQVVDAGDPLGLMGGAALEGPEAMLAGLGGEADLLGSDPGELGPQGAADRVAGAATGASGLGADRQMERRSETLYFEVRRGGQTIDPGTWFEGTKDAN